LRFHSMKLHLCKASTCWLRRSGYWKQQFVFVVWVWSSVRRFLWILQQEKVF
jgi:hypothetical protein